MYTDKLDLANANHMVHLYMFCSKHNLVLAMDSKQATVTFPCGQACKVEITPEGNKFAAEKAFYELMKQVKKVLKMQREVADWENELHTDYLENTI